MDTRMYTPGLVESAQTRHNMFHDLEDTRQWLKSLQQKTAYRVEEVPLDALDHWYFEEQTGNLKHSSGRFFSIVGLDCKPMDENTPGWQQPIISQPEVGILGILTREFDGVRYFLMQAKMEPGNINKVQISPTLQATYSNYTQAHKGKTPAYLEYFLDPQARIMCSQLQSETGSRFFRKFNNNILLDVTDEVEVLPGFRWLTLHEIQLLMATDNAINMDSRSVLSNVSFCGADARCERGASCFFRSACCGASAALKTHAELQHWLGAMRHKFAIETAQVPLRAVKDWVWDEQGIHHAFRNYFTIAGVSVEAAEREVSSWRQPLLKHEGLGLAGFLCAEIRGVLHFLMQAKPEPGIVGNVELGPTVSIFDYQRREEACGRVPFLEYFLDPRDSKVLHSSIQSEEGGRFWNLCNHFVVLEVPNHESLSRLERYEWMTLEQLQWFTQGESLVNSEARTLLSCVQYFHHERLVPRLGDFMAMVARGMPRSRTEFAPH